MPAHMEGMGMLQPTGWQQGHSGEIRRTQTGESVDQTVGMVATAHLADSDRTKSEGRDFVVGLDGLEPTTSVLSGLRSNRLSYRPTVRLSLYPVPGKAQAVARV